MNELEKYLADNTAQLVKIETMVARLIERVDSINTTDSKILSCNVDSDNEADELDLNPYAILCNMAAKTH